MSEEYAAKVLQRSLALITGNFGFSATTSVSFEVLLDIWSRYIEKLTTDLRQNVDQFGRSEPILDDVGLVFETNGISLRELWDYMQQTVPAPLPYKVPRFPVQKRDWILCAKPSEKELSERPDHIPSYCPSLYSSRKEESEEESGSPGASDKEPGRQSDSNPARIRRQTSTRLNRQGTSDPSGLPDYSDLDALKAGLVGVVEPSPSPPPAPTPPPPVITLTQPPTPQPPTVTKIKLVIPPPLSNRESPEGISESLVGFEPVSPVSEDKMEIEDAPPPPRPATVPTASLSVNIPRMSPAIQKELSLWNNPPAPVEKSAAQSSAGSSAVRGPLAPKGQKAPKKRAYVKKPKAKVSWKPPTQEELFGATIAIPSVAPPVVEAPPPSLSPPPSEQRRPNQEELKEKLVHTRLHFSKKDKLKLKLKERLQSRTAEKQKKKKAVQKTMKTFTPIASKKAGPPQQLEEPSLSVPVLTLKVPAIPPVPEVEKEEGSPSLLSAVKPQKKHLTPVKKGTPKKQSGKLISPLRIKFKGFPLGPGRKSTGGEDVKILRKKKKKDKQKEKIKKKVDNKRADIPAADIQTPDETPIVAPLLPPVVEARPPPVKDEPPKKVPRLILKLSKPSEDVAAEAPKPEPKSSPPPLEPLKVAPLRVSLKDVGLPRKKSPSPAPAPPLPAFSWEGSPPPKSPSLHSRSPGSEIAEKANSPPPHTPSPHSNSDHSPLRTDIQSDIYDDVPPRTPSAGIPNQCVPSPATKVISPAQTGSTSPAISGISGGGSSVDESGEKEWFCPVCGVKYEEDADMIGCDNCDNWFHWACVGLLEAPPEDQNWYCNDCPPKTKKVGRTGSQSSSARGRKKTPASKRGKKKAK